VTPGSTTSSRSAGVEPGGDTGPVPTTASETTWSRTDAADVAALTPGAVLARLETTVDGLTSHEALSRTGLVGPNTVRTQHTRWWVVLGRQLHSALFLLLIVTAALSFFVGSKSDAVIIGVILAISIGLGFVNEFRAELAAEALHTQIHHDVVVRRDGRAVSLDARELVPGDVVRLSMGELVPADVRVLTTDSLECDESILTGESVAAAKSPAPVTAGTGLADTSSCAYMGTIVQSGSALAVVVSTGRSTEFGRIAVGLTDRRHETEFQKGLREFSVLLVRVAGALTTSILVINLLLHRNFLESVLFSLAIAVGITPQLLPAVVTTSLAAGSRRLAHKKVLVKRLVSIEDLGNIELLLTDKTGTLTEGHVTFERAIDVDGAPSKSVLELGLACNEATTEGEAVIGGNPLDVALWAAGRQLGVTAPDRQLALLPFDHERRMTSVLVESSEHGRRIVTKGAPESVLERCVGVDDAARALLDAEFRAGSRVIAVATRPAPGSSTITAADESGLGLVGFLIFLDQAKAGAAASLERLAQLGVTVKVVTGDNATVAEKVCRDLGLVSRGTLTGSEMADLDDEAIRDRLPETTIFARVSPEQKAQLIRLHRATGRDVAFLGDGVNDAVALHTADVGISVDSGADVAKDAADIVLLEKDLGVLAEGVAEGRRTFANTIKYVLMGTSSNFGNMFSAAVASTFLSFLPMLPSQILLNNLLYDSSQMTIPTDNVDPEMLTRPAHWDVAFIRRFMLFFGPISSLFDFATFAIMLGVFHAGPALFRSGWFVESLATQTLVVFVIRTRRVPFWRSRPSLPMLVAVITVVLVAAYLPYSPVSHDLGFKALPATFFLALAVMVVAYLTFVEFGKRRFFEHVPPPVRVAHTHERHLQRVIRRRATRWTRHDPRFVRTGR
jgi:Mg2+-importing ATPase